VIILDTLRLYYNLKEKYKSSNATLKKYALDELVNEIIKTKIEKSTYDNDTLFEQIMIAFTDNESYSRRDPNFNFIDGWLIFLFLYNRLSNEVFGTKDELDYIICLFEDLEVDAKTKFQIKKFINELIELLYHVVKEKYPLGYLAFKQEMDLYFPKFKSTSVITEYKSHINSFQKTSFNSLKKTQKNNNKTFKDALSCFIFAFFQMLLIVITSICTLDRLLIFEEIIFSLMYWWCTNSKYNINRLNNPSNNILELSGNITQRAIIIITQIILCIIFKYNVVLIIFITIEMILLLFIKWFNEYTENSDFIICLINIIICCGLILFFVIFFSDCIKNLDQFFKFAKPRQILNELGKNMKIESGSLLVLTIIMYVVVNEFGLLFLKKSRCNKGSYFVLSNTTKFFYMMLFIIFIFGIIKNFKFGGPMLILIYLIPYALSLTIYLLRKKKLRKKFPSP